jgi:hypothetical protein
VLVEKCAAPSFALRARVREYACPIRAVMAYPQTNTVAAVWSAGGETGGPVTDFDIGPKGRVVTGRLCSRETRLSAQRGSSRRQLPVD